MIAYDTLVGAILIGNRAKRGQYTTGALMAFMKFSRAEVGHSLGERGRA